MNWNDRRPVSKPKKTKRPVPREFPKAKPSPESQGQGRLFKLEETSPGYRAFKEMAERRRRERDG